MCAHINSLAAVDENKVRLGATETCEALTRHLSGTKYS